MKRSKLKPNRSILFLSYVLFLGLSVFYLYWFVNYLFFYQEKSSLFLLTFSYLAEHLSQPGGFLKYLGELQSAFYYYPLAGAGMVSLEICVVVFLIALTGKEITGRMVFFVPFAAGAALFYLQTHYQYSSFNTIGILLQLLFFLLTIRFLKGKREWFAVAFFPGWYLLTGSYSLVYLSLFLFHSVFQKGSEAWLKPLVMLAAGVLFFYIGERFLFYQSPETLLVFPFSPQNTGMQIKLFVPVVAGISLLPVVFKIQRRVNNNFAFWFQFSPFMIIVFMVLLAPQRIDKKNSHYFHVEKLFYQQQYDKIIAFNSQFPSNNMLTNYLNNIALAETGILTDALFRFPQSPDGSTLFLKWDLSSEILKRGGWFYYSLGMINEANRWAYEYMVMRGNTPEGLKMLIKTELINGNYAVAEKYIHILGQSVFYRDEAQKFRQMLFNDGKVEADSELGAKRKLKTRQDFFVLAENPLASLDGILAADSTNRMALQYQFAWLLLQKDYAQVTELLPMLENAGFQWIPKNIEEAVVAYCLLNQLPFPALEKLAINPQTPQQFQQYYQIFQQNGDTREQAQRALQKYAGTYWYYVFFN